MATADATNKPINSNRVEVVSTGLDSLDYLMDGGWHFFEKYRPSVVIKGQPGCGKSILASMFAAECVRKKRSALYLSLEQPANEIRKMMTQFTWGKRLRNDIVCSADSAFHQRLAMDLPVILIGHIALNLQTARAYTERHLDKSAGGRQLEGWMERLTAWYDKLHQYIEQFVSSLPVGSMIVVDALSDVLHRGLSTEEEGAYHLQRGLFQTLAEMGRKRGLIMVTVLEKKADHDWRDYVADVVIDLGWKDGIDGNRKRYLQIEKARFTPVIPGRHDMRLLPRTGIEIYPVHREVLRREQFQLKGSPRRTKFFGQGRQEALDSGEIEFCGDQGVRQMLDGSGILKGSSILVYGPDNTRKNVFAARFLQQGLRESDEAGLSNARVLFVSAGLRCEVAKSMLGRYLEPELTDVQDRLKRIDVLAVHEFGENRDELFNRVRRELDQRGIVRIAVDDIAAFRPSPDEVLPLKELFSKRGITSLFVHTVDPGQESPIRESFDTFIRSCHITLPSITTKRIGYRVVKLNGATRGSIRSWELIYHEQSRTLLIEDSFNGYVEGRDGRLIALPLRLMTHSEYPDTRDQWNRQVHAAFGSRKEDDIKQQPKPVIVETFVREQAEEQFEDLLILEPDFDLPETWVVSFDEFWFEELLRKNRLINLDKYVAGDIWESFFSKTLATVRASNESSRLNNQKTGVYGIPQYLNFGVYVINRDLVTNEILDANGLRLDQPQPWDTWFQVARMAQKEFSYRKSVDTIAKYHGDAGEAGANFPLPPKAFDFPDTFAENHICTILEFLWPFLFRGGTYRGFKDEHLLEAVCNWYTQLQEAGSLPLGRKEEGQPAIIERHWVVSLWRQLRLDSARKRNLIVIPAPTMTDPSDRGVVSTASICGDWFLGIIKGSPNIERGLQAIKTLTSIPMNKRMFEKQIGLPSHKSLFVREDLREFGEQYDRTVSRRCIHRYYEVRPILYEVFRNLFGRADLGTEHIRGMFSDLEERIQRIWKSSSYDDKC